MTPPTPVLTSPTTPTLYRKGRREAGAMMWNWQSPGVVVGPHAAPGLRKAGLTRSAIGLVAAAVLYALSLHVVAAIAGTIALVTGALALASPQHGYKALHGWMDRFAVGVGTVVTWLVMVPIFALVFMPFGMLFRRGERDPLKRAWDRGLSTYWETRTDDMTRPERHERPY